MTIIVGLIDQGFGHVCMGADTVRSNGNRYVDRNSKLTRMVVKRPYSNENREIVRETTHIIVGASGSVRAGQIVSAMYAPDWHMGKSAYEYLVGSFVVAVRNALDEAGQIGKSPIQSDETELTLLVAIDGGLFIIWQDFSVTQPVEPYAAIGSGTDLALGALFTTNDTDTLLEAAVLNALRAAAAYDYGCGAPFDLSVSGESIYRVDE